MSDTADKQSKTFDPTPRRLKKARDEGQVAKSREVASAGVVLAGGIAIVSTGADVMESFIRGTIFACRRTSEAATDMRAVQDVFATSISDVGMTLTPFIFLIVTVALLSHIAQTGIVIAPKALAPKFSRINVFSRLKETLSPGPALMRTSVAVLKMIFIGVVVAIVAMDEIGDVQLAVSRSVDSMLLRLGESVVRIFIAAGVALSLVGVIDFAYQKSRHIKNLKMTRDEVKRENREDEGSPELKGFRKRRAREISLNQVIREVPKADVIVTNPTHFAVALRYQQGKDVAPRVVSKGVESMALNIRRIARQNGVPIVENRRLARTLHRKVRVGHLVPPDFFEAVAEVLAHVYRIRQRTIGGRR